MVHQISKKMKNKIVIILPIVICIIASIIIYYSTRNGIGISPDSIQYIASAQSYLDGNGLKVLDDNGGWKPLVHWPPLYPLALVLIGKLGIDPIMGARYLNIVLIAINLILVGHLIKIYTNSKKASFFAMFLGLSSTGMLSIHSMAWSESLFLCMILSGWLSYYHFWHKNNFLFLLLAGILFGSSYMCRYSGIPFVLSVVISLLSDNRKNNISRLKNTVVFFIPFLVLASLWMIRNYAMQEIVLGRKIGLYGINAEQIRSIGSTLSSWLLPVNMPDLLRLIVLCTILLVLTHKFIYLVAQKIKDKRLLPIKFPRIDPLKIGILFVIMYESFLLAVAFFFDFNLDMGIRMHVPAYICLLIFSISYLKTKHHKIIFLRINTNKIGSILVLIVFLSYSASLCFFLVTVDQDWLWYTNKSWRESAALKVAKKSNNAIIYSNAPEVIYYYSGNTNVFSMPNFNMKDSTEKVQYLIFKMSKNLQKNVGMLIRFKNIPWRSTITDEDLEKIPSLFFYAETDDATIYKAK